MNGARTAGDRRYDRPVMVHRFLLTVLPGSALSAEVDRLRNVLHARIGTFSGRNTPPHVTLCFLDLSAAKESAIVDAITQGTTGQHAFALHYHGITHFPDKRTIYIDPVEKEVIATVRIPIIAAMKADEALHTSIRETDHPHLTIAAGLGPGQFERSWQLLAPHEFSQEDRVTEVVLLKRVLRPGSRYERVRGFALR